jgi:hypothetical protein
MKWDIGVTMYPFIFPEPSMPRESNHDQHFFRRVQCKSYNVPYITGYNVATSAGVTRIFNYDTNGEK